MRPREHRNLLMKVLNGWIDPESDPWRRDLETSPILRRLCEQTEVGPVDEQIEGTTEVRADSYRQARQ